MPTPPDTLPLAPPRTAEPEAPLAEPDGTLVDGVWRTSPHPPPEAEEVLAHAARVIGDIEASPEYAAYCRRLAERRAREREAAA